MREAAEALGVGGADAPLFVEFTALLTWDGAAAASLGWHDDASGGPHLAQRHVSAVLYLNTAGTDFGAPHSPPRKRALAAADVSRLDDERAAASFL